MISVFYENIRRAALYCAALLFLASPVNASLLDVKSKKSETSKDIIEKAYNLSLQKDRSQAINILVGAIKQENFQSGNTAELIKALQQVSYLFYSDRSQQNYELALSLRKSDPTQALQKISDALRIENDNLSLFNEQQRMAIIRGDCSGALENINKERLHNPFDEYLILLQAQANACLGKWDAYLKGRDASEYKKSAQSKFWTVLEIEYQISTGNSMKAKDLQAGLFKLDPRYPESLYWGWRLANATEKDSIGQKYVKECKNLSAALYRQYMIDIKLCRRMTEIETASKISNGTP